MNHQERIGMKQGLQIFSFSTSIITAFALATSVSVLSACGGGGGAAGNSGTSGNNPGNTQSSVPSPSGSVSANFVPNGNTPQFILSTSYGIQAIGGLATAPVQVSGVVTTLGKYSFSGSPAVAQDVAGDANFAMGRWVWGTVSDTSTTPSTVLDMMNASYASDTFTWHYLLLNNASAWPSSGTMTCDNGVFTKPTVTAGVTTAPVTTGSLATLSFTLAGISKATLGFTLTTTDGSASNVANFSANLGYGSMVSVHGVGAGASDTWILLSDGGSGAIRINGLYSTALPNGNTYQGVFSFKCQ